VILLSSCSYTPSTTARSSIITEPCDIAVVSPENGTVIQLIEANEDNYYKNKPLCDKKFEQIKKYDDINKPWYQWW
jgi:hypothetical protein